MDIGLSYIQGLWRLSAQCSKQHRTFDPFNILSQFQVSSVLPSTKRYNSCTEAVTEG